MHEDLKRQGRNEPKHIRAGNLDEARKPDALPAGKKRPLDINIMIADRANTGVTATADIDPDPATKTLRVRILGTADNASLGGSPTELNRSRTVFPGTDLRLLLELPESAAKPAIGVA